MAKNSPYIKNYFCRRCSGVGNGGKRHWILKDSLPLLRYLFTGEAVRCPDCGGPLRNRAVCKPDVESEVEVYQIRLGH